MCQVLHFLDVFTDGSCWYPSQPQLRFASFAIVAACTLTNDSWILQASTLPGVLQSAFRAELFACRQVLRWACANKQSVRVWIDCNAVLQKLKRLQTTSVLPSRTTKHSDLWRDIHACLHNEHGVRFVFTKVGAHQPLDICDDTFEEWVFTHNGNADRQASLSNQQRPPDFWSLFHAHQVQVRAVTDINREVQRHLLRVSHAVLQKQKTKEEHPSPQDYLEGNPAVAPRPAHEWTPLPQRALCSLDVRSKFGDRQCQALCEWYWNVLSGSESPAEWISLYQLYIDYMGTTGHGGPVVVQHKWYDPELEPDLVLTPFLFKRRCSWWGRMFREVLDCLGAKPQLTFGRPKSHMFSLHTNCCFIPWPLSRCEIVERWVGKHLNHPATRNGDTVNRLPGDRGPRNIGHTSAEQHVA